jgi:hypothetical protein
VAGAAAKTPALESKSAADERAKPLHDLRVLEDQISIAESGNFLRKAGATGATPFSRQRKTRDAKTRHHTTKSS